MARKPHPLDAVRVLRRLEVGPVSLSPRGLTAPYTVTTKEQQQTFELIYRYEEDVFDPNERGSQNLAALIAAQVALNYGLFCKEIVFRGPLDRHDRRWLADMAENTAREILVKKLLEPNPFLLGAARDLTLPKQERYLHAELLFAQARAGGTSRDEPTTWATDTAACAVLSSGGKDSLLSHGLLSETGSVVHPLFVNESGRHWHTAIRAYRHFSEAVPNTARVWTNADRAFSWMLRQLPFVRPDFAQVRSDEYPLRLWTVAVFLFGALPLVRKRGIARLVIGNEFDTSVRKKHDGLRHYDGLYDQSRYFDRTMSGYYRRKGWSLSQFSILRPLSELLIEKILVERYPDLQALQMSCHATHHEDGQVRPCGACEKCRRIVGMLTALGADPKRCGYTPEQTQRCLDRLATSGVHQEAAGVEQLKHLLAERGVVSSVDGGGRKIRQQPEVLRLRFDRDHAPLDAIPRSLRAPLYRLMLAHADGAVRRVGRQWVAFDPLGDEALTTPFPFETPSRSVERQASNRESPAEPRAVAEVERRPVEAVPAPRRPYLLGELSWPEAKQRFKEVDVALLPVGAIEQHGPHLPLDTDAYDAEYLAVQVAEACSRPQPIVLPLVPYGVSYHHADFAGTISVTNSTLSNLIVDIGMCAARNGITKLVIINGHGGNTPTLQFAAQLINRDARIFTCVDSGETSDADIDQICDTPNDVHAGEVETSTSLATRPHLVNMKRAKKLVPRFSSQYLNFTATRRVEWFARTSKISRSGVLGDPTKASEAKGHRVWEVMVRNLVELVEDLKRMTLEEIYDRRY